MLKLECASIREEILKQGGNEQLLDELLEKLRLWLKQQLHLPQSLFILTYRFLYKKRKYI